MSDQAPSPDTPVRTQLGAETRLQAADAADLVQALAFGCATKAGSGST